MRIDLQEPRCSSGPNSRERKCSIYCDSQVECSVLGTVIGGSGKGECTTTGGSNQVCSSLQPRSSPPQSGSFCSVAGADSSGCSTIEAGFKPKCSVFNPGSSANQCSVKERTNDPAPGSACSVFGSGQEHRCSVFRTRIGTPNDKTCPLYTQNLANCSILASRRDTTEICTVNDNKAGRNNCSAHVGFPRMVCSVMDQQMSGTRCSIWGESLKCRAEP